MSEPLLKKRLHISGLTPSISSEDLERRLSSFGKVMAMDGFGARDALGDPRKFGFVTMEIGAKELAKCGSETSESLGLNVLSGSMWRGAKLRIGEAKPDFRERLAETHSQSPQQPVRPRRALARNYGHVSSTLPLVPLSATVAASTPGWVSTASGRVVRPMRMRPERPLGPMHSELRASTVKGVNGKVKKRVKPPLIRARRRLIDPTKWDSIYLKGAFLDSVSIPLLTSNDVPGPLGRMEYGSMDEEKEETTKEMRVGEVDDVEIVPRDFESDRSRVTGKGKGDTDVPMERPPVGFEASAQTVEPVPRADLRALFAPREEASFSLLDHLDLELDLELDADIFGTTAPHSVSQEDDRPSKSVLHSLPLLFPPPDLLPYPSTAPSDLTTTFRQHGASTCFLFPSATQVRGLLRLPPSITFTRSPQDTSEFIREAWEKERSMLTHEWKKAWREAKGARRRKVGAGGHV